MDRLPWKVLLMALLITLCNCTSNPNEGDDASISLGTGTTDFVSLNDNQTLPLIAGIQGGYHFIVHAQVRGELIAGDSRSPGLVGNPQTSFAIYRENGERIDGEAPPYRLGYVEEREKLYSLPSGRQVRLDVNLQNTLVPAIYGERLRLTVGLRDASGLRLGDETWIVATEGVPD